jgi:hypothetical protein
MVGCEGGARRSNPVFMSLDGMERRSKSNLETGLKSRSIIVPSGLPLFCFRLDAHRPSGDGGELGFGFHESAAPWAEVRPVPDHAHRDTIDVRNFGAAKPKRIAAARLFLLLRVSLPCSWPYQYRDHRAQHQAELDIPGACRHCESPECCFRRIVSEALGNGKNDSTSQRKPSWKSPRAVGKPQSGTAATVSSQTASLAIETSGPVALLVSL